MWMNRHSIRKSSDATATVAAATTATVAAVSAGEADGNDGAKPTTGKDSTEPADNLFSEKSVMELMAGATDEAVMI
jgi:ABC-type xylose transport system substrate-binding protein